MVVVTLRATVAVATAVRCGGPSRLAGIWSARAGRDGGVLGALAERGGWLALTTTASGTILPTVQETGGWSARWVPLPAIGTVGDTTPIVAVSVILTGHNPMRTTLLLVGLAELAAWRATRPRSRRLARLVTATLGSSGQLRSRCGALLIVVAMVRVAGEFGLDVVLGAFAAGFVFRLFLDPGDPHEAEVIESKLDGIGFGLSVPLFFVPMIVVIATIGVERGVLEPSTAAARACCRW